MLIVPHASGQSGLVTLKLATNLLEGGTGCHEWEAGFFLAEFVLSRPDIFKGMLCTSLHHVSPARCTLLDKCTLQPCMSSVITQQPAHAILCFVCYNSYKFVARYPAANASHNKQSCHSLYNITASQKRKCHCEMFFFHKIIACI